VSLPKGEDPHTTTLTHAIELINERRKHDQERHLKTFAEDETLQVLNGRYGPYLTHNGKNYRLTKTQQAKAQDLTYEECMEIIKKS